MKTVLSVLLVLLATMAPAAVTLEWEPSSSPEVTSYVLYWGPESGKYVQQLNVGNVKQATVEDLPWGFWFFVVVARDDLNGLESDPSNEVSCFRPPKRPAAPRDLRIPPQLRK
jgi:hypothetical protein